MVAGSEGDAGGDQATPARKKDDRHAWRNAAALAGLLLLVGALYRIESAGHQARKEATAGENGSRASLSRPANEAKAEDVKQATVEEGLGSLQADVGEGLGSLQADVGEDARRAGVVADGLPDAPSPPLDALAPPPLDTQALAAASADVKLTGVTPGGVAVTDAAPFVPPGRFEQDSAGFAFTESYLGAYSVPHDVHTASVGIMAYHRRAKVNITLAGPPSNSGQAVSAHPKKLQLGVGPNPFRIAVTSADGSTTRRYAFTIWRMASSGSPYDEVINRLMSPTVPAHCSRNAGSRGCAAGQRCVYGRCVCPPLLAAYRNALPFAAARDSTVCSARGSHVPKELWCLPPMQLLRPNELFDSRGPRNVASDAVYSREVSVTSKPVTIDAFTVSKAAGAGLELLRPKPGRSIHDHDITGLRHLGVRFDTCAVVAPEMAHSREELGALIDAHDAVLRLDDMGTMFREAHVGRRTTLRWQPADAGFSEGKGDLPGGRELCLVPLGGYDPGMFSGETNEAARCEYRELAPGLAEYLAGTWHARVPPNSSPKERRMGAAFSLVAIAAQLCGQVTVFGRFAEKKMSSPERACVEHLRKHRVIQAGGK